MLPILARRYLDDELIGKLALGHDLRRSWRGRHALLFLAVGTALLPFDHPHSKLRRLTGQLLTRLVTNDRPFAPALWTATIFWAAGNDLFASLQALRQSFPARMVGTGLLGPGQWVLLLVGRALRLLFDFFRHQTHLLQEQGNLRWRELLALGTETDANDSRRTGGAERCPWGALTFNDLMRLAHMNLTFWR